MFSIFLLDLREAWAFRMLTLFATRGKCLLVRHTYSCVHLNTSVVTQWPLGGAREVWICREMWISLDTPCLLMTLSAGYCFQHVLSFLITVVFLHGLNNQTCLFQSCLYAASFLWFAGWKQTWCGAHSNSRSYLEVK